MTAAAGTDSTNFVIDMVCDVCRIQGFAIEKNVPAEHDPPLFIDIVASRKRGRKEQKVAFECWEGEAQVNGREVESFVKRLHNLGLVSGVYVSPRGFTGDAEFVARKLRVELWDLAKLKEQFEKIKPPERVKVPGTLPVSRSVPARIFSNQLENGAILKMASLPKLEFRPYYFAKFEARGNKKKAGKGVVVLDGVDGRVCDAALFQGNISKLPSTGFFVDCLDVEPLTGSMPKLPPELEMKNTVTVAPAGVAGDAVVGLVTETLQKESGISPEQVVVTDVNLLHVPIVTVEVTAGQKVYRKIVQAATGRMIWDDTVKCSLCEQSSKAICGVCGGTVCVEHIRLCSSCQKHLCADCVTTKGILNKSPLCPECKKTGS